MTLPTGTVTFLFTDLEGSTRLWEEHPDAMRDALARHDEILRTAVEAHGGHMVKTTGDGVHAAFATADAALASAVTGQRALDAEAWDRTGPLRVRMGVHTGLAQQRDGDYYGPALNRAARLMSVAHGGQVVVSLATAELVSDDLPDGLGLLDLGEHRLRDLVRSERVYQLTAPGLETDFPDLRTIDAFPGNLVPMPSSFVGRERERRELADALGAARLVTVIGVGGVGKTRLAGQVAAEVLPHYADGAWLCELATAGDPDSFAQLVAATLGVRPRPGVTLTESIVEFLRVRELLLVLDNCEHLLDDTGRLAEAILRGAPRVRVLATSREALAVPGEQVFPLRSLPVPDDVSLEAVGQSDAGALFADRARAVRPGFALDAANAAAVAEICRRLDGIPLALELAAARVAMMSPAEIAGLLDERFRLLTGGRRTAVERHQTLRATVEWSYSLLPEVERTVFDRLGVFAGTFDAAGATAVASGEGIEAWDVLDALGGLVAKSMVSAEEVDGETRYSMLETLRQFARERLDESGETDRWRRRHAERAVAFAQEAGVALYGRDELAWQRRLRSELPELQAAVAWALDREDDADFEVGAQVIAHLAGGAFRYRWAGIDGWAQRARPRLGTTPPWVRRSVLAAEAVGDFYESEYDRAIATARDALADGPLLVGPDPQVPHLVIAMSEVFAGRPELALAAVAEGMAGLEARGAESEFEAAYLQSAEVVVAAIVASPDARRLAEENVEISRRLANPSQLSSALANFGWVVHRDDPTAALAALDESIALTRSGAMDAMLVQNLAQTAALRMRAGDGRGALRDLREAALQCRDRGGRVDFLGALDCAMFVLSRTGDPGAAATIAGVLRGGGIGQAMAMTGHDLRFEGALTTLRDELGVAAFDAAVARGSAMSYDEVVDFLSAELDGLLAD